jgi:hypothetical protein
MSKSERCTNATGAPVPDNKYFLMLFAIGRMRTGACGLYEAGSKIIADPAK